MLRRPGRKWFGFLFAPMLAIGLTLFSVLIDFSSVTVNHVIVYVFVILLAAAVTSFGLLLLTSATTGLFRKLWRKLLSTLILHELKKRYSEYSINISATGIGDQEGSVVVSLALGENNGISIGDLFQVVNIATKEQLGTVQSMTAEKTSCLCGHRQGQRRILGRAGKQDAKGPFTTIWGCIFTRSSAGFPRFRRAACRELEGSTHGNQWQRGSDTQ